MSSRTNDWDVVIIGGGPAGLTAALVLGRASRRVLVCDAGEPRNARSLSAQGLFTRDGTPPFELLKIAREQLAPYPSVRFEATRVQGLARTEDGFVAATEDGRSVRSRRILLATGVVDELPAIPGFHELWGTSVLHCPYCHGWEARDRPVALYANGQEAFDVCILLTGWYSDIVLCTDGPTGLTDDQRRLLSRNEIGIREEKVVRLKTRGSALEGIELESGMLDRTLLYVAQKRRPRVELLETLGCERAPDGSLKVNDSWQTTVSGLHVAGDVSRPSGHDLALAVFSGTRAATAINGSLLR